MLYFIQSICWNYLIEIFKLLWNGVLRNSSLLHLDSKDMQRIKSLRIQFVILKQNGNMDLESSF